MKGNVNWPLLVFYFTFEGWVLNFPLFGPILEPFSAAHGAHASPFATIFLFAFSLSFAGWGIIFRNHARELGRLRPLVMAFVLACLFLNLSLLVLPVGVWGIVFALMGIFGALPSLVWLAFVSKGLERNKIGWNLGITGVFVEMTIYAMSLLQSVLPVRVEFLVIQIFPIIALMTLLLFPRLFTLKAKDDDRVQQRPEQVVERSWLLYLFIFSFPLVGGIMYNVVRPLFLAGYPRLLAYYGTLPYVLAMPFAGYLADRKRARPVALYGLTSLGVAYTVFALSKSSLAAFTGDTFLNVGFAFMDLFVLFVLAWFAPRQLTVLYVGGGLAIYIFSILAGIWLTEVIVPHTHGNYGVVYLIAILIMFISFLLLEWIVKKNDPPNTFYGDIGEDLELARKLQHNMLPQQADFPKGWEITYTLEVAREVGGDFFDVIPLKNNRALFVIGDVMGKGLSAAMLVSSMLGQIRSLAENVQSLPEILSHVNRVLIRDARFSLYVTLGLVMLDKEKSALTYANAGHMPPYLFHNRKIQALEGSSLPVGTDPDVAYEEVAMDFIPGDVLLMYTDGVIEAKNERNELYSFERLEEQLRRCQSCSAAEVNRAITEDLEAFTGMQALEDDFTLLVVQAEHEHL